MYIVNGKCNINTETVQASKQLICKYCMHLCNCATVSCKEHLYTLYCQDECHNVGRTSHAWLNRRQQEVTSHSCGGIKYYTLSRAARVVKNGVSASRKMEARLLPAGQLGDRHPSKLASPHSLNWHGAHQVRQ